MESGAGSGGGGHGFYHPTFSHYNYGGGNLPELGIRIGLTPLPPNPMKNSGQSSTSVEAPPPRDGIDVCTVREQDRFMPIANIIRIMRKILPQHAKISDDAKETIQECVSEFISFVTGEANERCQREQRKTITAEDVLWAMSKLGFDDYIEPLTMYLHRSRLQLEKAAAAGDQPGKRSAVVLQFRLPGLPPLSPKPYAAARPPPPSFGLHRHQPPTGFFIPTPAAPATTSNVNRFLNGSPSTSGGKKPASGDA